MVAVKEKASRKMKKNQKYGRCIHRGYAGTGGDIMQKVLTIAGTDPSGGAGAQADLKTFMAHKVYGMSVITALVAQNTCGVRDIMNVTPAF